MVHFASVLRVHHIIMDVERVIRFQKSSLLQFTDLEVSDVMCYTGKILECPTGILHL